MIDTVEIEMLCNSEIINSDDLKAVLESCGYQVKEKKWKRAKYLAGTEHGSTVRIVGEDAVFVAPDGMQVPVGCVSFTWPKCVVMFTVGSVLHRHNAYLLSPKEVEYALRLYLSALGNSLPFVDVSSARFVRVDIYYQWRISGDYDPFALPFYLGETGPVRRFRIYYLAHTAMIWRSNMHKVRLYNKTVEQRAKNSPAGSTFEPDRMPDNIIRLEVELKSDLRSVWQKKELAFGVSGPVRRKPNSVRKNSLHARQAKDVLSYRNNRIPARGDIFDWEAIVSLLQVEWPGVYLCPASNPLEMVRGRGGAACTSLVLHEMPYLRPFFLDCKSSNRSEWARKLRRHISAPPQSRMHIPDQGELVSRFDAEHSPYYLQNVTAGSVLCSGDA